MVSRPKYFGRLLRFLQRKGRSREDAEDLVQEAMLRLHVYGQEVEVVNQEAFLRHTAHNLSIDQHRRDRLDLRTGVPIQDLGSHDPLIDPISPPEDTLEFQQRIHQIKAVLEAVSRRTCDIYFAHRAGYSYAEIADHMGISHITIKRHIARALLAIMNHLESENRGARHRTAE